MNCMKCGRETPAEKVFCEECLLEMEKYPVRPGTVVQLPPRRETVASKKISRKRSFSLEEQVKILKKRVILLTSLLAVLLCLLGALGYFLSQHFAQDHFKVGQNYSSVSSASSADDNGDRRNP